MNTDDRLAHIRALEQKALAAFAAQQWLACYRSIDRRCRLRPPPGPEAFLLRAEVGRRLGWDDAALADLRAARALDPHHLGSLRALLNASPDADERAATAHVLAAVASDWAVLREALGEFARGEVETVGALRRDGGTVRGWAAWRGGPPRLARSGTDDSIALPSDAAHPLAGSPWRACGVSFPVPSPGTRVAIMGAGETVASLIVPKPATTVVLPLGPGSGAGPLTVIVPIYGDAAATAACLRSLTAESGLGAHRLILVEDASPDPAITALVAAHEGDPRVTVLRNPVNLGFAASVNRALATLEVADDVVLLNADTVVPPGALDRLRRAGRSAPGIGTVTPLSNNGEYTSLPLPFVSNPLPERDALISLDRAASGVNAGGLVDLPSGVGFCLLITSACLTALGGLSEHYARGYLEDVDYCLRARAVGLRNVCATDVVVGHAGSRSFADAKRALVVANERRLAARFPGHGAETAVFLGADPLGPARARIEAALPPAHRGGILLVGADSRPARPGATRLRSGLEQVAANLAEHGHDGLTLRLGVRDGAPSARLAGLGGARPQALRFDLARAGDRAALHEIVRAHAPICVTVYEAAGLSGALFDDLRALGVPMDYVLSDAGLLCPRGTLRRPDGTPCATIGGDAVCGGCESASANFDERGGDEAGAGDPARYRAAWRDRARAFDAVFVDGASSAGFVRRYLPDLADRLQVAPEPPFERRVPRERGRVLGVVVRRADPTTDAVLRALARCPTRAEDSHLVVLGSAIEDRALLSARGTWVTGPIADAVDFTHLIAAHGIDALVLADPAARFGHEADALARMAGCPLAAFDWSGAGPAHPNDLALDPAAPFADAARTVHRWHAALDGHHLP